MSKRSPATLAAEAAHKRAWRAANPEVERARKKQYYASEGAKAKRAAETPERATARRAAAAANRRARRASHPESRAAGIVAAHKQRVPFVEPELDAFVLHEAVLLADLRTQLFGFVWEIDHVVACSRGGTNAASNIQVVPRSWNRAKFNTHAERFLGAN